MTPQRFQAQFEKCCRQPLVIPKAPLTGIQKELREAEETRQFWNDLENSTNQR